MPIVSGTGSASGSATVTGIGGLILGTRGRSQSTANVQGIADLDASTGIGEADGSATVAGVGAAVRTLIASSAFTYESVAVTPFVASIRRNPDPRINNALGTTFPTATFRVGNEPDLGQYVQIDFGDGFGVLAEGVVLNKTEVFEGRPTHTAWDIEVVGDMWVLNSHCPFGCFTNVSATTVVQSLVANFAPGFTAVNVEAALPAVTVSFDGTKGFVDCLNEIAQQLTGGQGYFYVELRDLHFFQSELTNQPDELNNTTNHKLLFDPQITYKTDDSQIRNRASVLGASTTVAADVAANDTIIEIASSARFTEPGLVSTGCQRFSYTGTLVSSVSPQRPDGVTTHDIAQAIDPVTGQVLSGKIHLAVKYS